MKLTGKRILGRVFLTIFFIIPLFMVIEIPIFVSGGILGAYVVYSRNLPKIPELKRYQPRTVFHVLLGRRDSDRDLLQTEAIRQRARTDARTCGQGLPGR